MRTACPQPVAVLELAVTKAEPRLPAHATPGSGGSMDLQALEALWTAADSVLHVVCSHMSLTHYRSHAPPDTTAVRLPGTLHITERSAQVRTSADLTQHLGPGSVVQVEGLDEVRRRCWACCRREWH